MDVDACADVDPDAALVSVGSDDAPDADAEDGTSFPESSMITKHSGAPVPFVGRRGMSNWKNGKSYSFGKPRSAGNTPVSISKCASVPICMSAPTVNAVVNVSKSLSVIGVQLRLTPTTRAAFRFT